MSICRDSDVQVLLRGLTVGSALACALGLTQCKGAFTGPYPCESGYASCVNPEYNQCETQLLTDATHCGDCNKPCAIGGVCVDGHCEQAADKLTDLPSSSASTTPLAQLSGNYIYFSLSNDGTIYRASKDTRGAFESVASNVQYCSTVVPFAADANAVYYWTNSYQISCTGGGTCYSAGIAKTMTNQLTTSLTWPAAQDADSQCPFAFAVTSSSLYFFSSLNNGVALESSPLTGGSINTIATSSDKGWNAGLWVDSTRALFVGSSNGRTTLYQVTLSNGKTTEFSSTLNNQPFGVSAFAADNNYVYVASGGCSCDNYQSEVLPSGIITRFTWDGGTNTEIARFSGFIADMTIDGDAVYWATDTTVWKVPKAGGRATQLAGNLTNGATTHLCSGGCGMAMNSNLSLAVDSTSVYVVDTWSGVNALLKVAK
jgi:hypothetical protein